MHGDDFTVLMQRVRARDAEAAAELLQRYEGLVRRHVRVRLGNPQLRRVLDSMDVCQSVFASFWVRAVTGQFELNTPQDLLRLLRTIAQRKVAEQARKQATRRRGGGARVESLAPDCDALAVGPDPGCVAEAKDLLEQVLAGLTEQERRMVELRGQGHPWAKVARELGGTGQARRVQMSRAVMRVLRDKGLDGDDDE
jgi:RNA polymerase sigma-70 factor (ECF subfamily)